MHFMRFDNGIGDGMDTARGIGTRGIVGSLFFWLWFLPLCGLCLALIVYCASSILSVRAAERQREERIVSEASNDLAAYIASVASDNPVDKTVEEKFTRLNELGLVDRPKPAVWVGDRSLIFVQGLSWNMCRGLSGKVLGNVESVSLNGAPFTDYYDGSECRQTSYRTYWNPNWIAVVKKPATMP